MNISLDCLFILITGSYDGTNRHRVAHEISLEITSSINEINVEMLTSANIMNESMNDASNIMKQMITLSQHTRQYTDE